jgi:hypothetical protein
LIAGIIREKVAMVKGIQKDQALGALGHALPSISTVASFIALLTLAFTGMLYLAGWEERHKLLREFGFTNYAFDESIQTTFARGYRPLFLGMLVVLILGWVFWSLSKRILHGKSRTIGRLGLWYAAFWMGIGVLTCAYLAGNLSGSLRAERLASQMEEGCHTGCYIYYLGRSHYLGILLAQDTKRSALLTREGVVVVNTEAITRIVATSRISERVHNDRRGWPFVAILRE